MDTSEDLLLKARTDNYKLARILSWHLHDRIEMLIVDSEENANKSYQTDKSIRVRPVPLKAEVRATVNNCWVAIQPAGGGAGEAALAPPIMVAVSRRLCSSPA